MALDSARPDLLAALAEKGYRRTGPRLRVIELLGTKAEGFGAEEMCDALTGVGRATVYRTIKLLLDAGVVCRVPLPDGAPKYTLAPGGHHHHTVCVTCGAVGEFSDATVERVLASLGADVSGRIVGHRMEVHIQCRECLDSTAPRAPSGDPGESRGRAAR